MNVRRSSRDRSQERREIAWKLVFSLVVGLGIAAGMAGWTVDDVQNASRELISRIATSPTATPVINLKYVDEPMDEPADVSPGSPVGAPVDISVDLPVEVRVVVIGDVMLGRTVNAGSASRNDFTWPFQETRDVLLDADLTLGNLESPIVYGCKVSHDSTRFCSPPQSLQGLAWAGFDGLSLSNNHMLDYGEQGLEETVAYLMNAGIVPLYGEIVLEQNVRGVQVGVMGLNDVDEPLPTREVAATVEEMAARVDVLIGILHWGEEYQPEASIRQQELGRALVNAGMDVIIGAHPHWVQPVEEVKGGVIFYSLGNFVFDQMWSQETREGLIARLVITVYGGGTEIEYELIPVKIYYYGQPRLVEAGE